MEVVEIEEEEIFQHNAFAKILLVYYQSDTSCICTSTVKYLVPTAGRVTSTVGHVTCVNV